MKRIEKLVLELYRAGHITDMEGATLVCAVMFADDHCVSFAKQAGTIGIANIQKLLDDEPVDSSVEYYGDRHLPFI